MSKIIGIDLGTTNSVVAVMEGSQPKVLINSSGNRTTPSVVAFTEKGERLVGQPARHQQVTNPTNTVYSIKRFMGRRAGEVDSEEKIVPYEVFGGSDDFVKVKVRDLEYTPQEVSAMILQELKKTAEDYLGEPVEKAVITVPAYFNDSQRQATKDAGEIAGLKVERIINEPTAAALAYGLEKNTNARIAVFDLGGGTFDISILDVGDGVFEVLASNGDGHLGGDDFDQRIIDFVADEFRKRENIDIRDDPMALQRIKEAAEKAKCELSQQMETTINLPFITADQNGPNERARRRAAELLDQGFTTIKVKVGGKAEDDIARVRVVREVIGPDNELVLDANCGWDADTAIHCLHELEECNVALMEQPTPDGDYAAMARVRREAKPEIMADDICFDMIHARELIRNDCCDVISLYPGKNGGILKSKQIAEFAAKHGVACSIGSNLEWDVATAAMGHLIVATENMAIEKYPGDVLGPAYHEFSIAKNPLRVEGPVTTITDQPGLGVEVDWDVVKANRYE